MIPDEKFLTVNQILAIMKEAIEQNKTFSLVRVGDGENLILAQDSVLPIKEVLKQNWALEAKQGQKGVNLPNLRLRDEMVKAINEADVVGIPFLKNDPILTAQRLKRPLTEAVFKYFNIKPERICHTFVNRVFTQKREFWDLLKGRRILLIGGWAQKVRVILEREPYSLNVAFTHPFFGYDQIEETLKLVTHKKDHFDIALIGCGVNAVVLSQQIAESTGKVAIDFGKSLMFIVQRKAGLVYSSHQAHKDMVP